VLRIPEHRDPKKSAHVLLTLSEQFGKLTSSSFLIGPANTRIPVIPTQFRNICGVNPGPAQVQDVASLVIRLLAGTLSLKAICAFLLCAPNVNIDSVAAVASNAGYGPINDE
jgi:hypothetical protein